MTEKKMRAIIFAVVLCFLLAAPLFAAYGGGSYQSAGVFTVSSTGDYPTIDGEPLFTLHIVVPDSSYVAMESCNIISESLHDIGIEGIVHPLWFFSIMPGLYPEDYGVAQYGFERPSPPGLPEIVTVYEQRDEHFHHVFEEGVMWCGADDSGWWTPPGYGNDWDERLTKWFMLPPGVPYLTYSMQYDLEEYYDFAYLEISTDNVEWEVLEYYTGDSFGFADYSIDLTEYAGLTVALRFRVTSDGYYSDEDGYYDSNGALRIDWIEVSGNQRDDFITGNDGWVADTPPAEIEVMQGYDIAFLALHFYEMYGVDGFYRAHSESTANQGYFNPEYDALWEELEALSIDWDANFPDPPDLDNPDGQRALEILEELQEIWVEDQPCLVLHSRTLWDSPVHGFPISPWNLNNEYLANPEVRRAISMALRRQEILDLYGYQPPWEATAVQTWLSPWHPGFDEAFLPVYDPEEGLRILENYFLSKQVEDIADNVQNLIDDGMLKTGAGNSMTKKLESAIDLIVGDNYHAASQKLGDFINQVNALVRSGRLPVEYGEELIALAQDVIDFLGGS
ncbi:MAG: FIMAH domain-containing protein [Candidatus Thorarchaeota archaeon]